MRFRQFARKLGVKIGISFGLVAVILIGTILFTLLRVHYTDRINSNLANQINPSIAAYKQILETSHQAMADQRDWLITGNAQYLEALEIFRQDKAPMYIQEIKNLSTYLPAQDKAQLHETLAQLIESEKDLISNTALTQTEKINYFYSEILPKSNLIDSILSQNIKNEQNNLAANLQAAKQQLTYIFLINASFLFVGVILCILLGIILTNLITKPIRKLVNFSNALSEGNLEQKIYFNEAEEFERLSISLNKVINTFEHLADVTEKMSEGDYSHRVEVKSPKDRLAISANKMLDNLTTIVEQTNAIAAGNYNFEITPRSTTDTLNLALKHMTEILRANKDFTEQQNWLKDGLAKFAKFTHATDNIQSLCNKITSIISQHTNASLGALYLLQENQLRLEGIYAYQEQASLKTHYQLGEGVIGQVGLEGTFMRLDNTTIKLDLFVGTCPAQFVYMFPLLEEKNLIGVIALAWATEPNTMVPQYIESLMPALVSRISSTQHQLLTEKLLQEQQSLTEMLSTKQKELTSINAELAAQTNVLQTSREELLKKDEEQRKINVQLAERTKELESQKNQLENANFALKNASKELEEKAAELTQASQYKSEFLANMSHELRTPLNSLLILAKLLSENSEGNLTEEQVESARIMFKSGEDLLTLINDILDLAKVEAGKINVNLAPMNIQESVVSINSIFSVLAQEKGVTFSTEINKDVPAVIATDEQRVKQILRNLISNALKFTEKGYVKLLVENAAPDANISGMKLNGNKYIAFSVIDTGIGIPYEKQQLVFEAFQQADGTTSRKYGGTGLGLSISREFSKLLNGYITLKSEPGKGSTFTLYLPSDEVAATEESVQQPVHKEESKITSPAPPATKAFVLKKLLLVEDDLNFANILMTICRKKGYHCRHVTTAEEALTILESDLPDAILLDLILPHMDGLSLLDHIKQNPRTAGIPIQVISASDEKNAALKKGAIGYLTKPITQEQLTASLENIEKNLEKNIKSLLIVEDDPTLQNEIRKLMSKLDCQIETTDHGQEALKLLSTKQFDCVILDLGLPDLSGTEILKHYFDNPHTYNPAIIIYTGKELSTEETKLLNSYADKIVIKGDLTSVDTLLKETAKFLDETQNQPAEVPSSTQDKNEKTVFKILLVDDDKRNQFAIKKILEKEKYEITTAGNGKEAIDILQNNAFDLVLMDIMMPIMNGYDAIIEIRKNGRLKSLPIIALTAKALADDMQKCLDVGANDYIPKPINTDEIRSKIKRWRGFNQ